MTDGEGAHRTFLRQFLPNEGLLRAYLRAGTRDPDEAEELLQEVSALLWEKFDSFDPARPFRAWALGFARLQILKWKQKAARSREVLSDEALRLLENAAIESAATAEERRGVLQDCVKNLPSHLKDVLRLRYLEELPVARLAARVRKSVAAVEMTLVRTRRALKDCVDRKLQGANP
jgi:RNA polymerase sigma-70 factor (ECF subfamily)